MSKIVDGIKLLVDNSTVEAQHAKGIMKEIMSGQANDAQIGSFLTALRIKGETIDVISSAAEVMREFSNQIQPKKYENLVDTCGTGGDESGTFNISTLSAIVAAGAGVPIAKHGNRSVSSQCGSADILEKFGAKIDLSPEEVERVIDDIGFGFMFAPKFHPAMKHAMPTRKSLAMRTIFNILGPLTNPASAENHVLGVYDKSIVEKLAQAMSKLGAKRVFVVYSEPGIDEIVPISKVYISEVNYGKVNSYVLFPEDFGMEKFTLEDIQGGTPEVNLKIAKNILINKDKGLKRGIVVLNAAYAILSSGIAENLDNALRMAEDSLSKGKALKKLEQFVAATNGDLEIFKAVFD